LVEIPESKAASALESFSFKPSVDCPGTPMDPQLQLGDARQMLTPSRPSKKDSSKPASDIAATPAPVAATAIASSFEIAASISVPEFFPLPPVDGEGWSGVKRKPDKTSADGRIVGGGQDMAGLSSFPIEGGRGGKEFLPTGRRLLASTLALPDY
jgi:hypothetical protein